MSGMGHAGTSRRIQRFFACLVRRPTGLIRFSPLSCRSGQVFVQWSWSSVRFVWMPWLQVYIYTSGPGYIWWYLTGPSAVAKALSGGKAPLCKAARMCF